MDTGFWLRNYMLSIIKPLEQQQAIHHLLRL